MSNLLYPIYKLPEEFMQDYEKRELPRYMKYWLYLKSKIKKSIIKEGSSFDLNGTVNKKFIKFEIEGNTEQAQYNGKNLLNIADLDETVQGLRFRGNDKNELIISGTYTGSTNYVSFNYKNINLPAETYTFTADSNNQPSGINLRLWTRPTNLNLINGMNGTTSEVLTAFTFALIGISNNTNYNITYKIQLEKGSSKTSFEPYCGGIPAPNPDFPQPIKNVTGNANIKIQNKNLFNPNGEFENGFYGTDGIFYPNSSWRCMTVKCKQGDIFTRSGGNWGGIVTFWNNGTFISGFNSYSLTTTIPSGVNKVKFACRYPFTGDEQLEYDTTSTSYVEHQEQPLPFTLAEGQFLADEESLSDDGINKNEIQLILNGTENWIKRPNTNNTFQFSPEFITKTGLCTHYIKFKNGSEMDTKEGIYLSNTASIIITDLRFTTVEEFKQWLAEEFINNPVMLQVVTATSSKTIPYNATQATQYDAMKNAKTYKDKTYITSNSNELAPKLKIQYWENKENTLLNLNEIYYTENFENNISFNKKEESEEYQNEESN